MRQRRPPRPRPRRSFAFCRQRHPPRLPLFQPAKDSPGFGGGFEDKRIPAFSLFLSLSISLPLSHTHTHKNPPSLSPTPFPLFLSFIPSKKKKKTDRLPQARAQGRAQERAHRGALCLGGPGRRRGARAGPRPLDRGGVLVLPRSDGAPRGDSPRHDRRGQGRAPRGHARRGPRVGHRVHVEEALHRHRGPDQGRAALVLHPEAADADVEGLARRGARQAVWPQARVQHHAAVVPDPGAAGRVEELGQDQRAPGHGVGAQGAQARQGRSDDPALRGGDGRGRGARRPRRRRRGGRRRWLSSALGGEFFVFVFSSRGRERERERTGAFCF